MRLRAAVELLEALPLRQRTVVFLRGSGLSYSEISQMTGDSRCRVDHLLRRADAHIERVFADERERDQGVPAKLERLRRLENDPPEWLVAEIGKVTATNDRDSGATRVLLWRRAALAIDAYRAATGFNASDRGIGDERPVDPGREAYDAARRAIDALARAQDSHRQPRLARECRGVANP
jgi:hypothetical protein